MAGTYSGGMVRRLELAQALVSAPRLLMLDEPTIGLDPIARTSVWEHIHGVRAATGMTVLVTTHYMDEAEQYCDRVALMHQRPHPRTRHPRAAGADLRARRDDGSTPTLEDVFRDVAGSGSTRKEESSAMSAAPAAPPRVGCRPRRPPAAVPPRPAPAGVCCPPGSRDVRAWSWQKLRHDRTELYTRAIQPALWLLIFGETFTRIQGDPDRGGIPYLDYLAPGIIAQSAMFIAIFYGIRSSGSGTRASSPSCWSRRRPGPRWSPARPSPPG